MGYGWTGHLNSWRGGPFFERNYTMPGGYVGGRPKDESKLSRNPRQIRNRLRRKDRAMDADIEMYVEEKWGGYSLDQWDLQELARGRPRSPDGSFRGRPPKWLTPAIAQEAKRRLIHETYGLLGAHVELAVTVIGNLLKSKEVDMNGKPIVDAKTKLAAAQFIVNHIVGNPKAIVAMEDNTAAANALAAAIVLDDGLPQGHLVIEGEVADDDDELGD